ncbi:hypothetical protein MA16_Dca009767 [Dendrobium catenatum]|uniref:Uncharacterized protein n=1 Tax=Dendrobium catenatum TaxID=906689 RepID=A0A2I0VZ63_9ASPA|nr:hypothetical protein MA16_Dca009767 [Dendrobium catenatum]
MPLRKIYSKGTNGEASTSNSKKCPTHSKLAIGDKVKGQKIILDENLEIKDGINHEARKNIDLEEVHVCEKAELVNCLEALVQMVKQEKKKRMIGGKKLLLDHRWSSARRRNSAQVTPEFRSTSK